MRSGVKSGTVCLNVKSYLSLKLLNPTSENTPPSSRGPSPASHMGWFVFALDHVKLCEHTNILLICSCDQRNVYSSQTKSYVSRGNLCW